MDCADAFEVDQICQTEVLQYELDVPIQDASKQSCNALVTR